MATKFDTKQAITHIENIAVPHAPSRGYSWLGYRMMSDKFYHDQSRCHGNEI